MSLIHSSSLPTPLSVAPVMVPRPLLAPPLALKVNFSFVDAAPPPPPPCPLLPVMGVPTLEPLAVEV